MKNLLAMLALTSFASAQIGSVTLPHVFAVDSTPRVRYVHENDTVMANRVNQLKDTVNALQAGTAALSGLTASLPIFTNAQKRPVSNAVTGTGSVVMSSGPTVSGATMSGATYFTGDIDVASSRAAFVSGNADPQIYRSSDAGSAPFTQNGHLLVQARSDMSRSIYFVTGTTPAVRYEITGAGAHAVTGAMTISSTIALGGNEAFDYDEGTFTITYTGFTASVTGTARYTRVGKSVTLFLPAATGTSNTTAMAATGFPAGLVPARDQVVLVAQLQDNAGSFLGAALLNAVGDNITFSIKTTSEATSFGSTSFTNSGTKGVPTGATLNYTLQ